MTIITGPGFYTSTAGKCDARYTDDDFAFGYSPIGYTAIWVRTTGECIFAGYFKSERAQFGITGPWTDPPPPRHECWVNFYPGDSESIAHPSLETADKYHGGDRIGPARRMVEIREGEVIVPTEPTEAMLVAGSFELRHACAVRDAYRAMLEAVE